MLLQLDSSRMLDLWRLHAAHLPSFSDSVMTRADNLDADSLFRAEIDRWYRRQLLEAPRCLLKITDLKSEVRYLNSAAADGSTPITLPNSVVRVVAVRLRSWMRPARIATDPSDRLVLRQLHPYTRATASRPVALFCGNELRLYPPARPSDSIVTLDCVTLTEDLYEFDSSLLADIHPQNL